MSIFRQVVKTLLRRHMSYKGIVNVECAITDDIVNNIRNGEMQYQAYFDYEQLGNMIVRLHSGQIMMLYVDPVFERSSLGLGMIKMARKDCINFNGIHELWVVSGKQSKFWESIPGARWYDHVHRSVDSSGYRFITDIIDKED